MLLLELPSLDGLASGDLGELRVYPAYDPTLDPHTSVKVMNDIITLSKDQVLLYVTLVTLTLSLNCTAHSILIKFAQCLLFVKCDVLYLCYNFCLLTIDLP